MKNKTNLIISLLAVCTLVSCGNPSTSSSSSQETPSSSESVSQSESSSSSSSISSEMVLAKPTTIYLAGDSTVKTYSENQYIGGWGQYLNLFLDNNEVKVVNAAQGGRSTRSFINEGRLYDIDDPNFSVSFSQNDGKSIGSVIKEGDFLFIQFGHNDDDTKSSNYSTMYDRMVPLGEPDENGIYPTTPGTKTTTTVLPEAYVNKANDNEEDAALSAIAKYGSTYYAYDSGGTYKWFLKQYIDFARNKGAIPVLITPVARVKFSGGQIVGGAGLHGTDFAYVKAVRQLAQEEKCMLIDLFDFSKTMLETATSTYANYMMALKPNELVGTWPSGYDAAYGNVDAGYTGIEATHYNKYGAFLQSAAIVEAILEDECKPITEGEIFSFKGFVRNKPSSYIDPSNLMSKSTVASLEALLDTVKVTNPNRFYPDPNEVVGAIEQLDDLGEMTNENYLMFRDLCENIRTKYNNLNVDDRSQVVNLSKLEEYEAQVEAFVEANRPKPISTVVFDPSKLETNSSLKETVTLDGFTIVATSEKAVKVEEQGYNFSHNGVDYSVSKRVSLGGSAKFGQYRYISFETTGACRITAVCKSSGSDDRVLNLASSSNSVIGSFEAGAAHSITSIDVDSAGTYSVGSAGSGIYVFAIIIEYFA